MFTGGGTYRFVDGQLDNGTGEQVRLLPTNIDGANPTVWAWLGIEQVDGRQPRYFYFSLDADADEVDLGAVQQLAPDLAQYLAVPGESAYDAWRRAGNDGDEADFLASLIGPPGDIAAANEYTDEAVTQGLAAEVTRADAAYDPAGAAGAAYTAAVNAASSDAATKAATARDAAIASAAQDADTKAGNAQSAAVQAAALAAAGLYLPKALLTVDAFMAQTGTKIFGHRGAGMVTPEHTEAAYDYAIAHGIQAMELSVNVDSEGQLWCLHDLTLDRTTYNTGALNTYPSTGIANRVLTNGRVMLGQGWTDQPMVPLRRMLDKYLGKVVLFVEPKGNDAVVPLQNLLATSYPHANQSVIWKAHVGTSFVWPKNNGFRTWCYVDDWSSNAVLDGKDSLVDYWGVSTSMSSTRRKEIVARGKPVFSWPVYRRSQRAALEADGVVGLMSSDPVYVRGTTAQATASQWDQQVKESGGTPQTDYNTDAALKFSETGGWVSINRSRHLRARPVLPDRPRGRRVPHPVRDEVRPDQRRGPCGTRWPLPGEDIGRPLRVQHDQPEQRLSPDPPPQRRSQALPARHHPDRRDPARRRRHPHRRPRRRAVHDDPDRRHPHHDRSPSARQRSLDHRTHRGCLVPRRLLRAQQRQHQRRGFQTVLAEPRHHPALTRSRRLIYLIVPVNSGNTSNPASDTRCTVTTMSFPYRFSKVLSSVFTADTPEAIRPSNGALPFVKELLAAVPPFVAPSTMMDSSLRSTGVSLLLSTFSRIRNSVLFGSGSSYSSQSVNTFASRTVTSSPSGQA
ncbi:glycerophosphodiester phosphodiesterase [Streptomyces parvus]